VAGTGPPAVCSMERPDAIEVSVLHSLLHFRIHLSRRNHDGKGEEEGDEGQDEIQG
jgi:hypothetical protein